MKLSNIVLLDFSFGTRLFMSHSNLDPISIEYLAAYLKREGFIPTIIQKRGETEEDLVSKILEPQPDVVGFSANYQYQFPELLNLARKIKAKKREILNVFGGYHASLVPEIAQNEEIDFVVRNEGEKTITDLLETLERGRDLSDVEGISFSESGKVISTPNREPLNFSELPWPIREGNYFDNTGVIGISIPPMGKQRMAAVSYSRGCGAHCTFCPSRNTPVTRRKPEDVVNEIEYLKKEFGINMVYFTDLTFNPPDDKGKVLELCRELENRSLEINWTAMCQVRADEELLSAMKKAGAIRLMYGVETFYDSVKRKFAKRIPYDETKRTFEIGNKLGIINRAFYMVGNLDETEEIIRGYLDTMKDLTPDEMTMKITTPIVGTPLHRMYQSQGIITTNKFPEDWGKYDFNHLVIRHPNLSEEQLMKLREELFRGYYESREYEQHIKRKIKQHLYLKEGYEEFFRYMQNKGINISV